MQMNNISESGRYEESCIVKLILHKKLSVLSKPKQKPRQKSDLYNTALQELLYIYNNKDSNV